MIIRSGIYEYKEYTDILRPTQQHRVKIPYNKNCRLRVQVLHPERSIRCQRCVGNTKEPPRMSVISPLYVCLGERMERERVKRESLTKQYEQRVCNVEIGDVKKIFKQNISPLCNSYYIARS